MSKVLIMVGNIGSGKSTWIKKFLKEQKEKYYVVSKDALRFMFGGGNYVFEPEKLEPIIDFHSEELIYYLLDNNINVIVDETNCDIITRANLIDLIFPEIELTAVVMPVLSKEESLKRKKETSFGVSPEVWDEVWEMKNSKYIAPNEYEGFTKIINVKENND